MGVFMNSVYGAIILTVIILSFSFFYFAKTRTKTRQHAIVSQAMLQHRYSAGKKYARKLKTKSQSKNRQQETNIRVIIVDEKAYWIKDNIFYKAPLINNLVDKDSAEKVDTSDMDRVQLDQMLFILDKLREGISDDSRGSGNA